MTDPEPRKAAKPGKACLGCYRRKLKCSRDQTGCTNCAQANLPCVFPTADKGVKRKRGPYKKDKPARERHLEHLVKYLEPRETSGGGSRSEDGFTATGEHKRSVASVGVPQDKPSASEDLVKDALIALTQTSFAEQGSRSESREKVQPLLSTFQSPPSYGPLEGLNLTPARYVQYWHLYQARVDPVTKLLHCPTLAEAFFSNLAKLDGLGPDMQTLICSICFLSVGTCTAKEAEKRFGEPQESLLRRYSTIIESSFADDSGMPTLESLQALVLYMIGIRRKDDGTSLSALFGLARRLSQMLNLHEDPGTRYRPWEAELRRRLWWHLCSVESRAAEESSVRAKSIKDNSNVKLPGNYSDIDLCFRATKLPAPCKGRSDMTPVLLRWESQNMVHELWKVKKSITVNQPPLSQKEILAQQNYIFDRTEARLELEYVQHLHESRPIDWWGLRYHELLRVKVRLMIKHPYSQVPTKDMSSLERSQILQSSVAIIKITHNMVTDPRVEAWHWYGRGYVQWHALAIVVAELGRMKNKAFASSAWAVLDPILTDWDRLYSLKKEEPAWVHVNKLISRARQLRHAEMQATDDDKNPTEASSDHHPILPKATLMQPQPIGPTSNIPSGPDIPADQNSASLAFLPNAYELPTPGSVPFIPQQNLTPLSLHEQRGQYGGIPIDPTAFTPDMDLASFDDLDQIDFGAFDAVFGGDVWDLENLQGAFEPHCPNMLFSGMD